MVTVFVVNINIQYLIQQYTKSIFIPSLTRCLRTYYMYIYNSHNHQPPAVQRYDDN